MFDFDTSLERKGTGSLKWQPFEDRDIIPCWVADMDFAPPPAVSAALHARIDTGVLGYSLPTQTLKETVAAFIKRHYRWDIEPSWINWTPGLGFALHLVGQAVCEPGESIATFTPIYPPFMSNPARAGYDVIQVPLAVSGKRYVFDFDALENSLRPDTRLLLLCNPHNPVGRCCTREELETLAEVVLKHDLTVCSDEVHADLILDPGCTHIPFATLSPEIADRTITLHAPSKTFNIPGLSCAFSVTSNPTLRSRMAKLMRGYGLDIPLLGLTGCEAAYSDGDAWLQELVTYLRGNLAFARDYLQQHCPHIGLFDHEATYLSWLDARSVPDAYQRCLDAGVAPSPGADFAGPGFLRLNLGCPRERLAAICERLAVAFNQ